MATDGLSSCLSNLSVTHNINNNFCSQLSVATFLVRRRLLHDVWWRAQIQVHKLTQNSHLKPTNYLTCPARLLFSRRLDQSRIDRRRHLQWLWPQRSKPIGLLAGDSTWKKSLSPLQTFGRSKSCCHSTQATHSPSECGPFAFGRDLSISIDRSNSIHCRPICR